MTTLRAAVVSLLIAACGASSAHPIPIAVVVDGDPAAVGDLPRVDGLELRRVALPAPAQAGTHDSEPTVALARKAYVAGDFATCRTILAAIDIPAELAAGERSLASRALTLATACAFGAAAKSDAMTTAAQLASYGLELPSATVSPDVETLIGNAIEAAGSAARGQLAVSGVVGARLSVDGLPACALPCTIPLARGDHVVAVAADGYAPATRTVRIPDETTIAIAQAVASPELAANQWRARMARGAPVGDPVGAALLGAIGRDRRVAYVHGDRVLTGELVVDGKLAATAEAGHGRSAALVRELAYDARVLHRPPVWQRPWFLIAVTGVALAAVAATLYVNRPTEIVVR